MVNALAIQSIIDHGDKNTFKQHVNFLETFIYPILSRIIDDYEVLTLNILKKYETEIIHIKIKKAIIQKHTELSFTLEQLNILDQMVTEHLNTIDDF